MASSGFKHLVSMADLPVSKAHEERGTETPSNLKVHATTRSSLSGILKDGLVPRGDSFCKVWGPERIPHWIQRIESHEEDEEKYEKVLGEILQCREDGVYFWDDYNEGVGQALATVGYLKKDEPAVLVVNTEGLKLNEDPEMRAQDITTDSVSFVYDGSVPLDRIECVCELREDKRPSVGALMCPMMHEKDECGMSDELESLREKLMELDSWECRCRGPLGA